jgi:hypothetical protein
MSDERKNLPYIGVDLETLLRMNIIPDEDTLACNIRIGPQQIQSTSVRHIPPSEMLEIRDALGQIHDFENSCNLYEICDSNYESIMSFHSQLAINYPTNRNQADEFMKDAAQEMNRLLLNYLSSLKTFLDHLNTRYSHSPLKEHQYLSTFNNICSTCFDTSFHYRFFLKLRDYVQHCSLPVQYVEIKENPSRIDISMCFDRDVLLNNFDKWGRPVKKDLAQLPQRFFEIIPSLAEMRNQIKIINTVVSSIEVSIALGSYQRLCGLIDEVSAQYPDGYPFIGRSVKPNTPEASLQMTNFPFHEIRKFRQKHAEIQKLGDRTEVA